MESDHTRFEYCKSRAKYRDSKQPTAVKVYTVADESKYLLVFGVPKINLIAEIKKEFRKFGELKCTTLVTNELSKTGLADEIDPFTDCYKIAFDKLEHARRAKKFLDAKNFYGGILHVSYAPEYETVDELRQKLTQRRKEVSYRIRLNARQNQIASTTQKRSSDSDDIASCTKKAKLQSTI